MKFRDRILLSKIEATEGVDPEPDGSNAIRSQDITWNPYEGNRITVEDDRPGLGAFEEINPEKHIVASFSSMLVGSGIIDGGTGELTPPGIDPLLRACGLAATVSVGEDEIEYTPVSSDYESTALWLIRRAIMHKSFGMRGNLTINLGAGELPRVDFDQMTGSYVRPVEPESVEPNLEAFPTARPFGFDNTPTFEIDGFAGCVQSFSHNLGNTVSWRDIANCLGAIIEDRQGTGTVVVEAPDVTTKNFFEALESHDGITVVPIHIVHGTTAGLIVEISVPRAQLRNISEQNQQGDLFYSIEYGALPAVGEDDGDIFITFR